MTGLPWILGFHEHIICPHSLLGLANSSFKILSQDKIMGRKRGSGGGGGDRGEDDNKSGATRGGAPRP